MAEQRLHHHSVQWNVHGSSHVVLYIILHFYFLCSGVWGAALAMSNTGPCSPGDTARACDWHAEHLTLSMDLCKELQDKEMCRSFLNLRSSDIQLTLCYHFFQEMHFYFSNYEKKQLKTVNGGCGFDKFCRPNSLMSFQRELFHFPIISKQRNSISITSFQNVPAGSGANYHVLSVMENSPTAS